MHHRSLPDFQQIYLEPFENFLVWLSASQIMKSKMNSQYWLGLYSIETFRPRWYQLCHNFIGISSCNLSCSIYRRDKTFHLQLNWRRLGLWLFHHLFLIVFWPFSPQRWVLISSNHRCYPVQKPSLVCHRDVSEARTAWVQLHAKHRSWLSPQASSSLVSEPDLC
jgi:hypothetical protein